MTDHHTDKHPVHLDSVDAQSAKRSSKFWWMFIISTILVVVAMIVIFANASV